MKKAGLYRKNWFLALLIGVSFIAASSGGLPLLERLEQFAYDAGVRMTHRHAATNENVAIVAIDDASIERIGRWPWPRTVLAEVLEGLSRTKARAIGLLISLTEPQTDPGLGHVRLLKDYINNTRFPKQAAGEVRELGNLLSQAENELDADGRLARILSRVRHLYLPMFFQLGMTSGKAKTEPPTFVQRNRLTRVFESSGQPTAAITTKRMEYPLERFGEHTAGLGHLNRFKDAGDGVRSETLVLEHRGDYYPSLALLLAARQLNRGQRDIEVDLGLGLRLGNLHIRTDPDMRIYPGFYPGSNEKPAFMTYSFHDVRAKKVPDSAFKNKIVLIGTTAAAAGNGYVTPISSNMHDPELTANVIASILNQDFYTRPVWADWAELGSLVAALLFLTLIWPRVSAGVATVASFTLIIGLVGAEHYLMISERIWVRGVTPALMLLVGHLLLTTQRFISAGHLKLAAQSDSIQSNRMLGLAFQNQGQLDMAMDKFRRLPVDDSVLELIYNLALDFERKRYFNKAVAAYDYILQQAPKFNDVSERKKRALQADNAILLGSRAATPNGTLILDGVDQKPTLGRYELEQELGRGAMGTVYLGRDPKINRVVAIKTLAISQEFDEAEVQKVKQRFFREAETAGRLNHPNIVTIYDVGEEHDLAYIAMEYLQGKDLTHYLQSGEPLPIDWVMKNISSVAEALDYAHKQNVVHRDIKPANIMYNEEDDSIKVTDFGIARITAASKTKTGVVLGTPSYMSPEQLAGKDLDGRSDLFSLGVTLFELLTGQQPFTGDSMAALMYQIANTKHPDITRLRKGLPSCARAIVDRLLLKKPEKRYRSGNDLKRALEKCLNTMANIEARAS
jgi:eukaryotic-like serine/threonine-protein kinase